jgi:hypothetical protein
MHEVVRKHWARAKTLSTTLCLIEMHPFISRLLHARDARCHQFSRCSWCSLSGKTSRMLEEEASADRQPILTDLSSGIPIERKEIIRMIALVDAGCSHSDFTDTRVHGVLIRQRIFLLGRRQKFIPRAKFVKAGQNIPECLHLVVPFARDRRGTVST